MDASSRSFGIVGGSTPGLAVWGWVVYRWGMTPWETFFSAFGGTATALVALGALFTFIIQHRLNLRLSSFNGELQKDLAKVTTELGIVAKMQEITFGYLHQERGKVIAQVYSNLVEANDMVENTLWAQKSAMAKDATPERQMSFRKKWESGTDQAEELVRSAKLYSSKNRIYLNGNVFGHVREAERLLSCLYIMSYKRLAGEFSERHLYKDQTVTVEELSNILRIEMAAALDLLDSEFKSLLRGEKCKKSSPAHPEQPPMG